MKLVIVESPTKTKSLGKYLGTDYVVMATMGHMRDLPKSNFGVEIVEGKGKAKVFKFEPTYEVTKGKEANVKKLKAAAKKASEIILASDPDREGEAIAWHTQNLLEDKQLKADKFKRVSFNAITKEAVTAAMAAPREIDMDLVDAQQARRVLDRIVGYKLSPVLWKKVRRGLSAGRVQSVAVRLIVDKEKEIEAFKSVDYWEISVAVSKDGESFVVDLTKIGDKPAEIKEEVVSQKIVADLDMANYQVEKVERKERLVKPNPPFKTSTLQQSAANVLGWSAKKTMSVAQRLYEKGVITYHRTDSLNLVGTAIDQIRALIVSKFGNECLPETAQFYKTGKQAVVAQEAHEAIRPAHFDEELSDEVDKDEKRLYELIWKRTIACQMKAAVVDQTNIYVKAVSGNDSYILKAVGEIMKFASWRQMYKQTEAVVLPAVKEGETLKKEKVDSIKKSTQPPARFNDASLIKELEKRGIGRPSTYAPTISTIIDRGYVEQKQKRFYATSVGVAVVDFLVKNFGEEVEYDFTAKMEESLDNIAGGKEKWQKVLSDFYGPFISLVKKADADAERVKVPVESTGKPCPDCKEGEIVIRQGRFGKFFSCSRFPECKYTARLILYVEGASCEKCGGRVVVKKTKTGREFYGCEKYPKCDWASWTKPKVEEKTENVDKEDENEENAG